MNGVGQNSSLASSRFDGVRRGATEASSENNLSSESVLQDPNNADLSLGLSEKLTDAEHPTMCAANTLQSRSMGVPSHTRPHQEQSHRSGTSTPWNPHNLIMDDERGLQKHRPTVARNLLHILGEFPVEVGQSDEGTGESRTLQDPLWLIAGLAERGWNLHSKHENQIGTRHPATLPRTSLPAQDASLLRKWTPQALQEVLKEQSRYHEYRLLSSKCDVAHALDPIHHGLLTNERAIELFQA